MLADDWTRLKREHPLSNVKAKPDTRVLIARPDPRTADAPRGQACRPDSDPIPQALESLARRPPPGRSHGAGRKSPF